MTLETNESHPKDRRELIASETMNVKLPSQGLIDHLADRLEQAYLLRRPAWHRGCSTRRVWAAAAARLWEAHVAARWLPLDCELYVASQPFDDSISDPWTELATAEAARRYRARVQRIIQRLRSELRREVRFAEKWLEMDGDRLTAGGRLSPLGCYIAAHRTGRVELAAHFATAAVAQHRSCPLYQSASRPLIAPEFYPVENALAEPAFEEAPPTSKKIAVMN